MALDTQGILAAVTIVMYVPFLFLSFKVVSKYGFSRGAGWILLLVFCISRSFVMLYSSHRFDFVISLVRVLGGSLLVAAENVTPVSTGLYIGGYALEASGLSPLLLCTLGLLQTMYVHHVFTFGWEGLNITIDSRRLMVNQGIISSSAFLTSSARSL